MTTAQFEALSAPLQAEEHRAYFVFGYRLKPDAGAGEGLAGLARTYGCGLLQRTLGDVLTRLRPDTPLGNGAGSPVWEEVDRQSARKGLHQDLMPTVDRILHGVAPEAGGEGREPAYGGDAPLALAEGNIRGALLLLPLGPAARRRLIRQGIEDARIDHLAAVVKDARLYRPASGQLLLSIGLAFCDLRDDGAPIPLPLVEEAVYALGHAADRGQILRAVLPESRVVLEDLAEGDWAMVDKARSYGLRKATPGEMALPAADGPRPRRLARAVSRKATKQRVLFGAPLGELGLNDLARALMGYTAVGVAPGGQICAPGGGEATNANRIQELGPRDHGRVFSFVAVQCAAAAGSEALATAAYRLSRRFTIDYDLAPDDVARGIVNTFSNVFHALATQGAAVVVRNTGPDFVQQFIGTAAVPTYLPLALLSYHEYLQLIHLTQDCGFIPNPRHPDGDMEKIQNLRYELAKFRLFFRFSHVSDIAHHNRIHRAWRDALDLDRMLQELVLDVREADLVLERHHREVQSRRWRVGGAITAAVAGFIAGLHICEAVFHLVFPDYKWWLLALKGEGTDWEALEHDPRFAAAVHFYHQAHAGEYGVLVIALIIAGGAAWVAWKKGPRLEE